MSERQKTIKQEVSLSGVGLHTGSRTTVRLKPAADNAGIQFRRTDIPGQPLIPMMPENIRSDIGVPRCTTIGLGEALIHTVEHLMGVLSAMGVDNLLVEIDGNEVPGLDGSGIDFLNAIKKSGLVEQSSPREYIEIREPIGVAQQGSSIFIFPGDGLQVSYTLDYPHPLLKSQFFFATVTSEVFEREIAPCRTFCLEEEATALKAKGLGKGANNENTLVVGSSGVINNQVRFPNEFARHKVLDIIGDLYLLGKPLRGHVFAVKSGHSLNVALLKKVYKQKKDYIQRGSITAQDYAGKKELGIQHIMKLLPHRYPFLLVDRIVELDQCKRAVGIKNVTINDSFFAGHFPSRPVMPGVLMVEAMAQIGGVLLLTNEEHHGKVALFMAADKVKFRKLVVPGDQLHIEVEIIRERSKTVMLKGTARVNEDVVAEAEILLSFTDASFLD